MGVCSAHRCRGGCFTQTGIQMSNQFALREDMLDQLISCGTVEVYITVPHVQEEEREGESERISLVMVGSFFSL